MRVSVFEMRIFGSVRLDSYVICESDCLSQNLVVQ